jgi:hypothetical protein
MFVWLGRKQGRKKRNEMFSIVWLRRENGGEGKYVRIFSS